jgi:hypothetical protein
MGELRERHRQVLTAVERGEVYLAPDWDYRVRGLAFARHVSDAVYLLERYSMLTLGHKGEIEITLRGVSWLTKRNLREQQKLCDVTSKVAA